ncbi:MAG: methyltransferase domain-containing protein [Mycobacteriales bacterium]
MADYALTLSDAELARYRSMAAAARRDEAAQWAAAGIVPGARVADVGCGPGAVLVAMAEVVGESGSVTGVDAEPQAVAAATAEIARFGLVNATAQQGQADDTGLEPSSYDVVVMRHVLAHNPQREQRIVEHLATLVRPGGCVYLVDIEGTALRWRPVDVDMEDMTEKYLAFHAARGADLQIGLRLGELLSGAGLDVVEHRGTYSIIQAPPGMRPPPWAARDAMVAEGAATVEDVARWDAALARLDQMPTRPTLFAPMFTAIGRRPV